MLKIKKIIGLVLASAITLTSFVGCSNGAGNQKGKTTVKTLQYIVA